MISKFIISKFIKNRVKDEKNLREYCGFFAGLVGIMTNLLLFIVKISIGFISGSIAVTADAFNNLSDVASSAITVISFKLSSRPADKEHPFGHGRIEYISALIVSFMVLLVGFEFIKASFQRILSPEKIFFQWIPFILILLSIAIKLWLGKFNKYVGKFIDSATLQASSFDAYSDVITSSCVALSFIASKFTNLPIDGYVGILVALFVLFSGFSLIKETISPLLGEAPSPQMVKNIIENVMSYKSITGVHDLIIHSYGPGKVMATIHAEVPSDLPIMKIHEIIDEAENEVSKRLGIILVIHMDPINIYDKEVITTKSEVMKIVTKYPCVSSIHDFRIVGEGEKKNLIFDIVINFSQKTSEDDIEKLKEDISKDIKLIHPLYNTIITIDRNYL